MHINKKMEEEEGECTLVHDNYANRRHCLCEGSMNLLALERPTPTTTALAFRIGIGLQVGLWIIQRF